MKPNATTQDLPVEFDRVCYDLALIHAQEEYHRALQKGDIYKEGKAIMFDYLKMQFSDAYSFFQNNSELQRNLFEGKKK